MASKNRSRWFGDEPRFVTLIGADWQSLILVPILAVISALVIGAFIIAVSTVDLLELWGESRHPVQVYEARLVGADAILLIAAILGAKELAEAEGVDLTLITGSGADGKIIKKDVEAHIGNSE